MLGRWLCSGLWARVKRLEERIDQLELVIKQLKDGSLLEFGTHLSITKEEECVTALLSGINLQIVNGEGQTNSTNCNGNLIIGYNEPHSEYPVKREGSHNLVLGIRHNYGSFAGFISGVANSITGEYCSILNGRECFANASHVSICNGTDHKGNGSMSTIVGGFDHDAANYAVVVGGVNNRAEGAYSVILGGTGQTASDANETIPPIP
jgi:hypothetical protein